MTVATTSREAYHSIRAEGREAAQKEQILEVVKDTAATWGHGMTRREISYQTGIEPGAVGGRVNALIAEGRLVDAEKRNCTVTGRLVKEVRLP